MLLSVEPVSELDEAELNAADEEINVLVTCAVEVTVVVTTLVVVKAPAAPLSVDELLVKLEPVSVLDMDEELDERLLE